MAFKYSTRQFIKEMQCRPCLWNVGSPEYNDKVARELAWVEIALIMYDDWSNLDSDEKAEKVKDLQKKWKGLRDYFNREKNKSGLQRNRKRPFLEMLNFLNATTRPNQGLAKHPPTETSRRKATVKNSISLLNSNQENSGATAAVTKLKQPTTREATEIQLNDPDTNFLLSILPDMKSMNTVQNFEFRFEVMTLIKNIKYSQQNADCYVYCGPGPSNFTKQVPKFKTATPDQELDIDPISNETALSSPADQKIILQFSPDISPS